MESLYVGIDVSKRTLDLSAWVKGEVLDLGSVANEETGFRELARLVKQQRRRKQAVHLVMEPTGGYEQPLVVWAWRRGWQVSLPNPWQVRRWAESQGRRAKTDKVDSRILTQYGHTMRPAVARPLPVEIEALDQLLRRKEDLEKMLRQEKNREESLQGRPNLPAAVKQNLTEMIELVKAGIAEIEAEVEALLARHPQLEAQRKLLLSVPGVGRKTVLPLLVLVIRWHTLTNGEGSGKSLTAYVGLDPAPFKSGSSVYKPPRISKKGNRAMRTALFVAAKGGTINGNSPLRQFFLHLVGKDKAKRLAWIAAARKILVWAWAVFRDQRPFQPEKALPAQFAS
jgi:transposase